MVFSTVTAARSNDRGQGPSCSDASAPSRAAASHRATSVSM